MITQQREEIKPNRTASPKQKARQGAPKRAPRAFASKNFAPSGAKQIGIISKSPGIQQNSGLFSGGVYAGKNSSCAASVFEPAGPQTGGLGRAQSAQQVLTARAYGAGGRPLLALKRRRAVLGQIPAYFLFFLKSPPLSPASSPMERAKARRASFWAELRPLGTATLTVTYWSPRPLPRR